MVWRIDDPQGNEAAKVRYEVVPYTRGVVLDLGCGPFKAFPHFLGVDNGHHAREFGWTFKPEIEVDTCERLTGVMSAEVAATLGVENCLSTDGAARGPWQVPDASCDAVFSSHLLEHIADFEGALAEWWRVIKPGGHLVLYLPHKRFYPNIGEPGANPDHKHDFDPSDIIAAMRKVPGGWALIVNEERNLDREYSFLQVYQKTPTFAVDAPDKDPFEWRRRQMLRNGRRNACVVRYGGIGDMIQSASVIEQVKREGYYVTVMTTPNGQEVVRHDPHIDEFMIQDHDQVPNHLLCEYWHVWSKKFDKFVNLSELVEGTLLSLPGRANHAWPDAVRRRHLGRNYVEFMHEVAEVPFVPNPRFYPTEDERGRVREWKEKLGTRAFTVMWGMAGSSHHKSYNNMDAVIAAALLKWPDLHWVLVGGIECQILEGGWEQEPRVHRLSGRIGVRESLALALGMDLVIGPETGILNAVSHEPMPKIIMLSHSSHENLTRDWVNTEALAAQGVSCYPCHRIHHDRTFCPEVKMPVKMLFPNLDVLDEHERRIVAESTDERGMYGTGAAACVAAIAPSQVVEAIARARARVGVPCEA